MKTSLILMSWLTYRLLTKNVELAKYPVEMLGIFLGFDLVGVRYYGGVNHNKVDLLVVL